MYIKQFRIRENSKTNKWIVAGFAIFSLLIGIAFGLLKAPSKTTLEMDPESTGHHSPLETDHALKDSKTLPDNESANESVSVLTILPQSISEGCEEDGNGYSYSGSSAIRLVSYTAEKGDTLASIARKFNTTANSIAVINSLTALDIVSEGRQLAIIENGAGTVCKVEKGDTLANISELYGVPEEIIIEANSLSSPEDLLVGQLLLLPGANTNQAVFQVASRASMFSWPVSGKVTDGFGWRVHPITGKDQFHEGIDVAAATGTAVRAAASGTVTFVGWSNGYGRLVTITHGEGYETKYGHLSKYIVAKDDSITKGQVLGYVGETGDATGPHLHFEVCISGNSKDPRGYLP